MTPFLQDVDFGNSWSLARLVTRQLEQSTVLELLTTAPGFKNRKEFGRKYDLLSRLDRMGVKITLNKNLHAKVFCFNREGVIFSTMVGSANLTDPGLTEHLELAFFSGREGVYHSVMANIRIFFRHRHSMSFSEWKVKERVQIAEAMREMPHDN